MGADHYRVAEYYTAAAEQSEDSAEAEGFWRHALLRSLLGLTAATALQTVVNAAGNDDSVEGDEVARNLAAWGQAVLPKTTEASAVNSPDAEGEEEAASDG